ncbi:MAG: flagellar assembly protein FliW [Lachnospira sp.]|nr:flagellar assembly protein FliW [Lachnospira sp.]
MKIQTKWFGEVEVDDSKIITFEKGIIGFEERKKYALVFDSEKEGGAEIMWLQSVDEVSLAIPVMKPEIVMPNYDPVVEDELVNALSDNIKDAELVVLVALTVPADLTKMTCNLKAPIIINVDAMNAVQLIADNSDYMVRFPIYDILNDKKEKGGE